jgi:hypothetical protein
MKRVKSLRDRQGQSYWPASQITATLIARFTVKPLRSTIFPFTPRVDIQSRTGFDPFRDLTFEKQQPTRGFPKRDFSSHDQIPNRRGGSANDFC